MSRKSHTCRAAAGAALIALGALAAAPAAAAGCDVPANAAKYAGTVVQQTNGLRAGVGAVRLRADPALTRAAQRHACDMARRGVMTHNGSGGTRPSDRVRAEGFSWRFVAENVAYGHPGPQHVTQGWVNSPGHRRNMLDRRAQRVGVAVAMRGNVPFWAMVLAAPR